MTQEQTWQEPGQERQAPGPHTGRFYAHPRVYMDDRLNYLNNLREKYGDVVHFKMGLWNIYLVNHPDNVRQVMVTDAAKTSKSRVIKVGRILLGDGLLSSEGELHKRQRRLMAPAFHRKRIEGYCKVMAAHSDALRQRWRHGQTVDMHAEMMELTLGIIGETMFGANVANAAREVNDCLENIFAMLNRLTGPAEAIKCILPLPSNFRFLRSIRRLNKIVYGMIAERHARPGSGDDVLSMLLDARDEEGDGKGMSDKQVRDEVLILFLAGHETTANALTWTWYLLTRQPEEEARLHAEIDAVLGDRPPTLDDLPKLPYTRMVLEESMRLFPPVYAIDRLVQEPMEVGGYPIPKGSTIFVSPWCMHHDSRFYPDPDRFDPGRWTPEAKAERPRHAYFPFGAGPRVCIGEQFAWAEATIILATLAQRWRARLVPGTVVEPFPLVTVRPKDGLPVTLEARNSP